MAELPEDLLETVERLTRRARRVPDDPEADAYRQRRDDLLAERGFTARVREEDAREVLVCHPEEWVVDGVVRTDRVDDLDRAAEIPLSGPGDPEEWAAVHEHNREVADAVRERHGDAHGENAAAFADFMSNHYAKPVEKATREEVEQFVEDYYVRNVWPSADAEDVVEESIERTLSLGRE
jgi:hypothetical protein